MLSDNLLFDFFPLIASISAMMVSQTVKLTLMALTKKPIHLLSLSRSGGMPSSHSALITAISLSIALKNGVTSSHFFLAVVLSLVVIYDARGIRHSVGKHAAILNQTVLAKNDHPLNEDIGHTLPEIIIGICLGITVPLALYSMIPF